MTENFVRVQKNGQRGFVLVFSIILALVVLTSLGLWYQQIIIQGFLGERLIQQRSMYVECKSLLPVLIDELGKTEPGDFDLIHENFMNISVEGKLRWRIDRSELINNKIRFTFYPMSTQGESLALTVMFENEV